MWWKRKHPEPEKKQILGHDFIKSGVVWTGEVEVGEQLIHVSIDDREGMPDPTFLLRLPAFEVEARNYLAHLPIHDYVLEDVSASVEGVSLRFVYKGNYEYPYEPDPETGEMLEEFVTVRFEADKIAYYSTETFH